MENLILGILEQADAQFKSGDAVCTLGKSNLRILIEGLENNTESHEVIRFCEEFRKNHLPLVSIK